MLYVRIHSIILSYHDMVSNKKKFNVIRYYLFNKKKQHEIHNVLLEYKLICIITTVGFTVTGFNIN